jgi:hypothetical protein
MYNYFDLYFVRSAGWFILAVDVKKENTLALQLVSEQDGAV